MPKKTGPKSKKLDFQSLDALLQWKPTLIDASDILGVSEDTLERRIKRKFKMTFAEYRTRKMSKTRMKLVQKALEKAFAGDNVMLIFCLKNLCGWQNDPVDTDLEVEEGLNLSYSLDKK